MADAEPMPVVYPVAPDLTTGVVTQLNDTPAPKGKRKRPPGFVHEKRKRGRKGKR